MFKSILEKKLPRIIVCCGSGGVGKTTISATIGIMGVLAGKRTLVLTIDPAKRLADSLGLDPFAEDVREVPLENFGISGQNPRVKLFAMMLDTKRTFDRIIFKYVSEASREKIFNNRYYQHLSKTLAGSREYMAMEKLHEIYHGGDYDLIVLDTPPTRKALDFLNAPQRLIDLLGHNFFWKIFKPYLRAGRLGFRFFSYLASPVIKSLGQILGTGVLRDTAEFFNLWDDILFEGFRKRARDVQNLLCSENTLFFAVASPMSVPLNEAIFLYKKLEENQISFGGFIINRVHPRFANVSQKDRTYLKKEGIDKDLQEKLISNLENYSRLGKLDATAIDELKKQVGPEVAVKKIPLFEFDIYNIKGLLKIREHLF